MIEPAVFADRATLMAAAAARIEAALSAAVERTGAACAALSGGSTPAPAYEILAEAQLDWSKISFALVDERFAPPSHPASNEALLRRALAPALGAGAALLPMYAPGCGLEEAAARADRLYAPLQIDLALMGMGEDGHTASWFPGAPDLGAALDPTSPRTVVAQHAPGAVGAAERLTLTRAALMRAGAVVLLIAGAEKRTKLAEAIGMAPEAAPVAALFQGGPAPEVLWSP